MNFKGSENATLDLAWFYKTRFPTVNNPGIPSKQRQLKRLGYDMKFVEATGNFWQHWFQKKIVTKMKWKKGIAGHESSSDQMWWKQKITDACTKRLDKIDMEFISYSSHISPLLLTETENPGSRTKHMWKHKHAGNGRRHEARGQEAQKASKKWAPSGDMIFLLTGK